MIRALKITGIAAAVLLGLLVAVVVWVMWTENGSRFALARAQGFLPADIDLGRLDGRLADNLTLRDVMVKLDGLELEIPIVQLQWSPGELLGGHLQIAELAARNLVYRALPTEAPQEPAEPFSLPERFDLPVSVAVQRLSVEDATLFPAPDAEPVEVSRLLLADVSFADARLAVNTLEVDSPMLAADGQLAATAAGDYPLEVDVSWRLEPAGYAPVDATTTLGGSLAELAVDQRFGAPYQTVLTGTVANLVEPQQPIGLDLRLDSDEVRLAAVQDGLPDASISLTANVDGPLDALRIAAEASGTDPESRRFLADLQALVEGERVTLETLTIRQPEREGRLDGSGRIALAQEVSADLSITWESLRWPLTGKPTVTSPRGSLELTGPLDDYRMNLQARLEPLDSPPVDLRVNGQGDLESIAVNLQARAGEGTVDGEVNAAWQPVIEADAALQVTNFDPSLLAADWPGSLNLMLDATARTDNDVLHVDIATLEADGRLRDQDLSVTARGRFAQTSPWPTVVVEELDAALGTTRLNVDGRLADTADLRWQVSSDDLSSVAPEAQGRIEGRGTVTGPLPKVAVTADLQASQLGYGENTLSDLALTADVHTSGESESSLDLRIRGASLAGTRLQQVTLEGSGRPAAHQLALDVDAEAGRGALGLRGRLEDAWGDSPVWHYTLTEGELGYGELAPWELAESAGGTVSAQQVQIQRQCWQTSEAHICLQGRRDGQGLAAELDLADLRFGYFAALLPENMELRGAVSASGRLSQPSGGALTGELSADTTAGRLTLAAASDDASGTVIELRPSRVSLHLDEDQTRGSAALNLEHAELRLELATDAALVAASGGAETARPASGQALTGNIRVDVPELAFVSELVPAMQDVGGSVSGDLGVEGTLGQPRLTGYLELQDGTVSVPEPGITLEELTVSLQGRGDSVGLAASAVSGGGNVELDGRFSLPGQALSANLSIAGSEFQVMNNSEARVFVSPDLTVEAGEERVAITGEVHVPQATITPGTQSPSAVTVSEDQVLVSEESELESEAQRELYASVRITLGDEVSFAGFGLTARFEGGVLIEQEPETPTTATGELQIVDGEYRAYGQGLVIDSGRIYFAGGPVTQPALDVRAVRRPQEGILVGAHVQGTLQSPSFELFSEPSMTQQEQLSYLVLGRSLDEAPDGQGSALSRAALAMGLKGGDFLAKNIGEQVGVDDIGIETGSGEAGAPSDPSQAALVVGKYLSPKLYVSYGIGLFNPESVLEMQYEISKNWKLVTQSSGESTGADVLYTIEVGGK